MEISLKKINDKYKHEAQVVGLVALNKVTNDSCLYLLPCGHKQVFYFSNIRRKLFRCNTCFREKHINAAKIADLELLTPYEQISGKLNCYRFKNCGHIKHIDASCVISKQFQCDTCWSLNLADKTEKLNALLLETNSRHNCRHVKFLCCNTIKEVLITSISNETLRCTPCFLKKKQTQLYNDVLKFNLKLLNKDTKKDYWFFELPCKHIKSMQATAARKNSYRCDQCFISSREHASSVYLLEISNKETTFLKLGYSKNTDNRVTQYRMSRGFTISVLEAIEFKTGYEAEVFENNLHEKYKNYNIDKKYTKKVMQNGFTECYPITLKEVLMKELQNLNVR